MGGRGGVNMMNVLTRRLLSSWWDFYQGAVGVWRGWARSRARADLIRICDQFNVSLRKVIVNQPANRWPVEMGSLDVWLVRGRDQPFREHSEN